MAELASVAGLGEGVSAADETGFLGRILAGDASAMAAFVREQAPRVQRLLVRLLGPRQDLEDLVQTTFLETLKALPGFERRSTLSTFVLGISVQVARRSMRPRRVDRASIALDDAPEPWAPLPLGEDHASRVEALRRVRRLLDDVAEPKRIAFMLWAFDAMDMGQIAELTGASVSATRSRVFYAQKELLSRAERDPYLREWLAERSP